MLGVFALWTALFVFKFYYTESYEQSHYRIGMDFALLIVPPFEILWKWYDFGKDRGEHDET